MRRSSEVVIVLVGAVVVGLIGYGLAVALGATHTTCSGSTSAGYCDTRPDALALLAIATGVIVGAVAAVAAGRQLRAGATE